METERTPLAETAIVTSLAVAVGLVATLSLRFFPGPPEGVPQLLVILVQIQIFVTTFNLILLVALLRTYTSLYRDLPNKYTRSLILLNLALLLYALTANPIVHLLVGFRAPPGSSPFVFIPHVFVGFAIVVLFYQSQA